MKLYGHPLSGHAHRVKSFLGLLGLEFEETTVDLMAGENKQPEFLKLSPLGQVPVLVDGDVVIRDSAAALVYLATKYDADRTWLPTDAETAAHIQEWLITGAKEVYDGPFACRLVKLIGAPFDYDAAAAKSADVLAMFDAHLAGRHWLVGDAPTIADVCNYSYIAVAPEGEIDLTPYANVTDWLKRIEGIDGFVGMPAAAELMAAK